MQTQLTLPLILSINMIFYIKPTPAITNLASNKNKNGRLSSDPVEILYRSIITRFSFITIQALGEIKEDSSSLKKISFLASSASNEEYYRPIQFKTLQKRLVNGSIAANLSQSKDCGYYFRVRTGNIKKCVKFSYCNVGSIYFMEHERMYWETFTEEKFCIENNPMCDPYLNWHIIFMKSDKTPMAQMNNNVLQVIRNAVMFLHSGSNNTSRIYFLQRSTWSPYPIPILGIVPILPSVQKYASSQLKNYELETIEIHLFMPIMPKYVQKYKFSILRKEKSTYPGLMVPHEILKFVNATDKDKFPPPRPLTYPNWIGIPYAINYQYWKVKQISTIIDFNYVVFVTAKPAPVSRSFEFLLNPFKRNVWLGLVISIVLIILGGAFISLITEQNNSEIDKSPNHTFSKNVPFQCLKIYKNVLNAFTSMTWLMKAILFPLLDQQYGNVNKKTEKNTQLRFIFSLWMLSVLVIVNLYKSSIASFLIQPSFTQPPETFNELVDFGYRVHIVHSLLTKEYVSKLLADKSRLPEFAFSPMLQELNDTRLCFRMIMKGKNVCVTLEIIVTALARSELTSPSGKDLFQISKEKLNPDLAAMSYSPSLPIKRVADLVISYLNEGGLIQKWSGVRTDFNSNAGRIQAIAQALNSTNKNSNTEVVGSDDMVYPLIILVTGCTASLIILLYEVLKRNRNQRATNIIWINP